jgi:GT2 family glycosyltransferase
VPAARIVVVDNGSTDGSWDDLAARLRSCTLVRISDNVGYARGNNIGAEALPGDSYLFVNSDAFVHKPASVSQLVRMLDRIEAGVVVPRLLRKDLTLDSTVVPLPTPGVAFLRATGLARLVPNHLQPRWGVYWDHSSSREIQAGFGAVMLVRGSLWSDLGGFREESFMYAEDVDLCWRARERGFEVWFAADAEFVHLGGASTRWDDSSRGERIGRANAGMIREHLSPARAVLALSVIRAGLAARVGYRALTGNAAAAARWAALRRGFGAREPAEAPLARPEFVVVRPDPLGDTGDDDSRPLRTEPEGLASPRQRAERGRQP